MTANQETVELLADLRLDMNAHPRDWRHRDGTPITEADLAMVMAATVDDWRGAQTIMQMRMLDARREMDALDEMDAIIKPYFAAAPADSTIGTILPTMSEAHRARFLELSAIVELGR